MFFIRKKVRCSKEGVRTPIFLKKAIVRQSSVETRRKFDKIVKATFQRETNNVL